MWAVHVLRFLLYIPWEVARPVRMCSVLDSLDVASSEIVQVSESGFSVGKNCAQEKVTDEGATGNWGASKGTAVTLCSSTVSTVWHGLSPTQRCVKA